MQQEITSSPLCQQFLLCVSQWDLLSAILSELQSHPREIQRSGITKNTRNDKLMCCIGIKNWQHIAAQYHLRRLTYKKACLLQYFRQIWQNCFSWKIQVINVAIADWAIHPSFMYLHHSRCIWIWLLFSSLWPFVWFPSVIKHLL